MGNLVDFHTRNKLLILSHSQKNYRLLGKLVADGKNLPIKELYQQYQLLLMEALKLKTTIRKNTNVSTVTARAYLMGANLIDAGGL